MPYGPHFDPMSRISVSQIFVKEHWSRRKESGLNSELTLCEVRLHQVEDFDTGGSSVA